MERNYQMETLVYSLDFLWESIFNISRVSSSGRVPILETLIFNYLLIFDSIYYY